jgi:hypothetical protein
MIKIAINQAAFDAIAASMPLGSVGYENEVTAKGERLIWLEARWVDKLSALLGRDHPDGGAGVRLMSRDSVLSAVAAHRC